jgi:hypothetical protein
VKTNRRRRPQRVFAANDSLALTFQRQVDRAADEILARGKRPTPHLLETRLGGGQHELKAALENWVRRFRQTDVRATAVVPPVTPDSISRRVGERRADVITRAVLAAGLAAAKRREQEQRAVRREDLTAEIARAQVRLVRLEERQGAQDPAMHLGNEIEKSRTRLLHMRAALAEELAPASPAYPRPKKLSHK